MLFLLPISASDSHLAPSLAQVLTKFGGLEQHSAMVIGSPIVAPETYAYAELMRPLFHSVETFILPRPTPNGWPQGCNAYFIQGARRQEAMGNTEPWYWFELDTTPVKPGWIQALVEEYALARKPFMGAKIETWLVKPDGSKFQDGWHMMGSGIYPSNLSHYSQIYTYATDEPWDVFCRWEIVKHMHDTLRIQHNWQTHQYMLTGKGDSIIRARQLKQSTHPTSLAILKNTMVLHGCKDTSLREIILAK